MHVYDCALLTAVYTRRVEVCQRHYIKKRKTNKIQKKHALLAIARRTNAFTPTTILTMLSFPPHLIYHFHLGETIESKGAQTPAQSSNSGGWCWRGSGRHTIIPVRSRLWTGQHAGKRLQSYHFGIRGLRCAYACAYVYVCSTVTITLCFAASYCTVQHPVLITTTKKALT